MGKTGVLVVEDDTGLREVLVDLFTSEGYAVYEAPDGQPALERMRTHPEGLVVLLDWMMPGVDGLAVLRAVAAESSLATRHVYILTTAAGNILPAELKQLARQLSVDMVFKPFDIDTLVDAVSQAASHLPRPAE